ncbi:MAG: LPXTG cell wall anchor domain-containing protein, partial [Oscillospiraceae bacterium]|nr:LPXTG cell wall anchor domain-containing protein [Oscillospiraceae bacterium]
MKNSGYTSSTSGNVTTYAYELVYRVRLQNEQDVFVENMVYPTNDTTTLSYKVVETVNGETIISGEKTLEFPIPSVHGYLVELEFMKLSSFGDPVRGAEFTLSHDTIACSVCRGDGSTAVAVPDQVKTSGEDGKVSFSGIPSGHQYTLVETKVPDGFGANGNTYSVTAAYDKITVAVKDKDGNELEWEGSIENLTSYRLPNTGGPGTDLYTMGGLLLMAAAAILLYSKKQRGKEGRVY